MRIELTKWAKGGRMAVGLLAATCTMAIVAGWSAAEAPAPRANDPPLIPREVLFGNPDKASAQLSPDGKYLSFLAPVNGVMNVWVGPVDKHADAKTVTKDTDRGIRVYNWAYTNQHVLYMQDVGGDEDWHVYSVNLADGAVKDLTPFDKVAAQISEVSPKYPQEILIGINDRNPELHDVYRVNVVTGDRTLLVQNKGYLGFVTNDDLQVPLAMKMSNDGGMEIHKADSMGKFQPFLKIPQEDSLTTQPLEFNKSGDTLYGLDSRGRDKSALVAMSMATGEARMLLEGSKADISGVMIHPTEKTIEAASENHLRTTWKVLDASVQADFNFLDKLAQGDWHVTSRTLDDKQWIVAYSLDNGPVRYFRYNRAARDAEFLFTNRSLLEQYKLTKQHPVSVTSRDGLELVCYLSLPPEADSDGDARPDHPLPMVLLVHGGPWARDEWGLDPEHQLLANRGYAVMSVNFRGSSGLGKKFLNAGNREWGAKMHDDLLDAVAWAVKEKIAIEDKVAISGGSYGGYATLVGMTMTPETFACGVDIVGPSNIITLLKTVPPYWAPMIQMFKDRVGDYTTDEGKKFLESRSPLNYTDQIKRPLLIGQGKNDPRVKQSEADQIVQAMTKKSIPVTYVLYPDEGHGFARPENRLSFYAVTEAFLAQHLGGRSEPLYSGFPGSSITVPHGAEHVPGLSEAVKAKS